MLYVNTYEPSQPAPRVGKKILAFLVCFGLVCTPAYAGVYAARISDLLFYEDGDLIYLYVEGGTQQKPTCAGSNGDYISFSLNRPRAKEYVAGLMMAFASGKSVTFYTAGACVDQSVSDTLRYFVVHN